MDGPAAPTATTQDPVLPQTGRFRDVLDRRSEWVEAMIILVPIAVMFVVLGFLARYFHDYLRLILIFFFAWLLAFLISPVADWLQRHAEAAARGRSPCIAVIVPGHPHRRARRPSRSSPRSPTRSSSSRRNCPIWPRTRRRSSTTSRTGSPSRGSTIDLVGAVQSVAADLLTGMADLMVGLFTGALSAFGTFIDAIIVISLAIFMAIDRDTIMRVGLDADPAEKREDALHVPASVGSAVRGLHPQPADPRGALRRLGLHRQPRLRAAVRAGDGVPRRADHGHPDLRPVCLVAAAGPRRRPGSYRRSR